MIKNMPFDEEVFDGILHRIMGGEHLKAICRGEGMPDYVTFIKWTWGEHGAPAGLDARYARARLQQANGYIEDMMELSDNHDRLVAESIDAAVAEINPADFEDIKDYERACRKAEWLAEQHSKEALRLMTDNRKWAAARLNAGRWGDKVALEHKTDPTNPPKVAVNVSSLSDEQLEQLRNLQTSLGGGDDGSG
jgi:hypothetical protein